MTSCLLACRAQLSQFSLKLTGCKEIRGKKKLSVKYLDIMSSEHGVAVLQIRDNLRIFSQISP